VSGPVSEPYWDWLTRVARTGATDDLRRGLLDRIPGWAVRDWRDLLMLLAPVHHVASRLGMDVPALFDEAAAAAPPAAAARVRDFGRREHGSPGAFGFAVEETADGPRYLNALAAAKRGGDSASRR
jgi:hypothetical protein